MTTHCVVIGRREIKEILFADSKIKAYGLNNFVRVDGQRRRNFELPDFAGGEEELYVALRQFARIDPLLGVKHHLESIGKEQKVVLVDRHSIDRFDLLLNCVAESVRGYAIAVIVIDPVAMRDTTEKARLYTLGADFIIDNSELSSITQLATTYGNSTKREVDATNKIGLLVLRAAILSAMAAGFASALAKGATEHGVKINDPSITVFMVCAVTTTVALILKKYHDSMLK